MDEELEIVVDEERLVEGQEQLAEAMETVVEEEQQDEVGSPLTSSAATYRTGLPSDEDEDEGEDDVASSLASIAEAYGTGLTSDEDENDAISPVTSSSSEEDFTWQRRYARKFLHTYVLDLFVEPRCDDTIAGNCKLNTTKVFTQYRLYFWP